MTTYGHVCEGCEHPVSDHRLQAEAESAAGPYECWIAGCACTIQQDAPMYALNQDQFTRQFPGWTSARHKGWTPPTQSVASSGHVGGGRRP